MSEERSGGDAARLIGELLDQRQAKANRDLLRGLVESALDLADGVPSRLDLKIATAALAEMGRAFHLFAPFRGVPKLTMFGSARTHQSDPLYAQAKELAARVAAEGWLVVTGAGPGIMAAGHEGAGPDMSLGVEIRLPFESASHPELAAEGRLVEMKYFFTRKLMLMKESAAFAVLPGGFGTLDEAFEMLTLLQTGKAEPAPIVLVDLPGEPYWEAWEGFVVGEVIRRGLASPTDAAFYRITDDVSVAVEEILGFYRNYHSRRFVGAIMVIRLRHSPSDDELEALNREFADICSPKGIWRTEPLGPERSDREYLDLPRVALELDLKYQGRFRQLIDALNTCGASTSAP
ncbi:MAG TPA: TIGR00730 family Rossman fold protein [Acidimicrobiales bacterium]|nr:TIGR00730 family Rossman fold protein [Acidimicrobiales bacterium]